MGHPDDSSDVSDSDSSTGDENEDYSPFVSAFARCSKIKEAGMTLLVDHSGRIKKRPSIKDLAVNRDVVLSVVEGSLGRVHQTPQLSAYTLQKAILVYYQDAKLFPEGICAAQPAVGDWALQNGVILKKLVSRFRRLMKRATGAKDKKLRRMKEKAHSMGWPPKKASVQRGSHEGLAELPYTAGVADVSTSASSDLGCSGVSTESSVLSEKLARIVGQLQSLKVAVGDPPATKPKSSTAASTDDDDDQKEELPFGGAGYTPKQRVALILERAKNRRLAKQTHEPDPKMVNATPAREDDSDRVPDYVYESLGGDIASAFPLSSQYVNKVKERRVAAGADVASAGSGDEGSDEGAKPKKKQPAAKKGNNPKKRIADPNWNFNEVRTSFISSFREQHGCPYKEAKAAWDSSSAKKNMLGKLSVSELKRRKFIGKGCDVNPWA